MKQVRIIQPVSSILGKVIEVPETDAELDAWLKDKGYQYGLDARSNVMAGFHLLGLVD